VGGGAGGEVSFAAPHFYGANSARKIRRIVCVARKCIGPSARRRRGPQDDKRWGSIKVDRTILSSVAEQMMNSSDVVVVGKSYRVARTGTRKFRTVRFVMDGVEYQGIEQNPEKPSRWGKLARDGHRVVQFRDLGSGKYVAVAVDGKVTEYGPK